MSDQAAPPAREASRAPRRRGLALGVLGWLIAAVSVVILIGLGVLAWLAWSFNATQQGQESLAQGLVPVTRDFAPGQPKPDDVLFRIAGTRELGSEVLPDLVAAWMRTRGYGGVSIQRGEQQVVVAGTRPRDGVAKEDVTSRTGRVVIALGSASGAFEAMSQERVEAVVSSRAIDPGEADRLSALGDLTSPDSERVIGLDAWIVIVSRDVPVTTMGAEVLERILGGDVTDWSQVDGNASGPIRVKLMESGDGLGGAPARGILGDREPVATALRFTDSDELAAAVAREPGSIGIVRRRANLAGARPLAVGERNARTVAPEPFTIETEAYPLSDRVRFYVGGSDGDRLARSFADFAVSPDGQAIVGRTGVLPLALRLERMQVPSEAPRDYLNFVRDAQRMNFDVRFRLGSNELDSRASADLQRFAAWVQAQRLDNRQIALLGFADNVGARATNLGLAQSRADTVSQELQRLGIAPGTIRSYGEAMPVGANSLETGRIRNRRVEVWICSPPACPLLDVSSATAEPVATGGGIPSGVRLGRLPPPQPGEEAPKG